MKNKLMIFIVGMVLVVLAACGGGSDGESTSSDSGSSKSSEESVALTFSHFWPSHHIVHTDVIEKLQSELAEKSDGRITLDLFPGNQLGNPDEHYELVVNGSADASLSVHGYTPGRFPAASVMDLPFIAKSSEEGSVIFSQLYDEFEVLQNEHNDTTPLWLFTGEPNQILSVNKPIKSLSDLKGLTVRSPSPLASQLITEFGGVPVSMPVTEIYESLDKGVIDAAFAGISTINDMGLSDVVDYITIANVSNSSMFTVMNTAKYEGLSEDDQNLIRDIVKNFTEETGAALDRAGQLGIDKANEVGIPIHELSDSEIAEWEEVTEPVIDNWVEEMNANDVPGRELFDRAKELSN